MRSTTAPSSCGRGSRSRQSIAHGILDDETYDWLAVVEAMLATGGRPVVVDEDRLAEANALARAATGIDVDVTGSAGLAGLLDLHAAGEIGPDERVAVLFTGVVRTRHFTRKEPTMRSFLGRDILSLKDFERNEFERVFEVCDELAPIARNRRNADLLVDKTLLTAFYQPSTRTRMATEAAMHRLGGHVLGFADAKMTRAGDFYQESMKDTVHMLEYYADVIAMRHFQQGAPAEAAQVGVDPRHQLRRRLGRAPDAGADRPVHDEAGARHARRAHVPPRRRHAHADDALDPLCDVAVRHRGVRRQPA